ncbi:MDR family MFS transporter [Devosia sp. FJ2-5-3]|uniref:MDR family MFS transporter n=1 Tax=Devosia sp. FJ2-5-3 TaxID=2976680 RepID=UPI0023D822CE|nr:MDR family MFS transporter [Devosia sp. FJ2-5-3]WEJ57417.1 MFS transporter [Devosia sp. FJ2-5-3]
MSDTQSPAETAPVQSVRLIIGAIATTIFLASLGQTIVSAALPIIVGQLGGLEHLTWVVIAYLLSSTVVAPIYGKLGDLYGRKIVLQIAIVLFLIGSVLSASANSMTFLIAARAIQGLGGGGLMVIAMTVVADVIPARQRGKVQGLFSAVFGVSAIAGPIFGGFIVEHFSWQWIFLLNLPVGIVALVVITMVLKPKGERVKRSVDYLGFVLLSTSLTALVLATSLGGTTWAWTSPQIIGLAILAAVVLAAFLYVETKAAEPVLPLVLFRNQTFTLFNAVGFLVGIAMFGSITFLPLYLQMAKGVSPTASAMQLVPMMAGMIGASMSSGFLMTRTGHYRFLPRLSTAILTIGLVLLGFMQLDTPTWQVSLYMLMIGVGIGPVNSVSVTAIQNATPPAMVGVATAGATLFRQIGGSIGISVLGALFSAGLNSRLANILPEGTEGAGSFSPGMVEGLPVELRAQVLEALASALHPVFFVAAGSAALAFVFTMLVEERPFVSGSRAKAQKVEIESDENALAAAGAGPAPASQAG